MPESECKQCGERLVAPTDGDLLALELQHHAKSERVAYSSKDEDETIIVHSCRTFTVFDEGGIHRIGVRVYAHGQYRSNLSKVFNPKDLYN